MLYEVITDTPEFPDTNCCMIIDPEDRLWLFNATDAWQLVANAGFGFRAPNVFDLGTLGNRPGNRFNIPNPDLDSERVVQLDAGFRYTVDRARIELMIYTLDYNDRNNFV